MRRNADFVAAGSTSVINNLALPVGDIFPLDGGDGVINAIDKSELNREWGVVSTGTAKPGDFNLDGKVNSIDWACMRFDFGKVDDLQPQATGSGTLGVSKHK